jgi:aspartate aminotransferase
MTKTASSSLDLSGLARDAGPHPDGRVSRLSAGLAGSEILRVATEIRALLAAGKPVCNLTVGDFSPRHFPVPARLASLIQAALDKGETNYPPANGTLELRESVRRFYLRELGLEYPLESFLITGGARPVVYCTLRTVCDPGDRVVYPIPTWNNHYYIHLAGGVGVKVPCRAEDRFLPGKDAVRAAIPGARVLCLNSPLNPAGTAIAPEALRGLSEVVLEENDARGRRGERPLYLLYDHIYWMLTFGDTLHVTPPELLPEMARYTIFVDGISKAFAATGLRVGWAVGPVDVIGKMATLLAHLGAWAPRPEQVATATLLDDPEGIREYHQTMKGGIERRLDRLHRGLQAMKSQGLRVESIPPMGAIYLTARFPVFGARTPEGAVLRTNEEIRKYLLESAGVGIVPFQAFGATDDDGWFRLSVGAVGEDELEAALPRLERALSALA